MEKAGIKGLSMAIVPVYALILGGKTSSGLVLLIFISADLLAIRHYFRYGQRDIIRNLFWPAVIGILLGVILGNYINDALFKDIIAVIIIGCLALMAFPAVSRQPAEKIRRPFWANTIGLITGFSTMIANVSSPILAIFLLALKLPKKEFIGTVVWFFFLINLVKLPFHIWVWETIQPSTLLTLLYAIPFIVIGFLIGLQIVGRIAERSFRYLIIGVTLIAALKLLFS